MLAVARALRRGYTQAQLEPDEAVAAMIDQVPGLDRDRLSTRARRRRADVDRGRAATSASWRPGRGAIPSVARD